MTYFPTISTFGLVVAVVTSVLIVMVIIAVISVVVVLHLVIPPITFV